MAVVKKISLDKFEKERKAYDIVECLVNNQDFKAKMLLTALTKTRNNGKPVLRLIFQSLLTDGNGVLSSVLLKSFNIRWYQLKMIGSFILPLILERFLNNLKFLFDREKLKISKIYTVNRISDSLLCINPAVFSFLFNSGLVAFTDRRISFTNSSSTYFTTLTRVPYIFSDTKFLIGIFKNLNFNLELLINGPGLFNKLLYNYANNLVFLSTNYHEKHPVLLHQSYSYLTGILDDLSKKSIRKIWERKDESVLAKAIGISLPKENNFDFYEKQSFEIITQNFSAINKATSHYLSNHKMKNIELSKEDIFNPELVNLSVDSMNIKESLEKINEDANHNSNDKD